MDHLPVEKCTATVKNVLIQALTQSKNYILRQYLLLKIKESGGIRMGNRENCLTIDSFAVRYALRGVVEGVSSYYQGAIAKEQMKDFAEKAKSELSLYDYRQRTSQWH